MGKDTNQMRCGKDYKMLLSYCVTVLLSLMLGVCFIFFPKTIWPFYPFVWLLPVAVVLYGLVVVVVNLCRCRWQLFLRSVLIVAVELVILLVAFFSMAILSAIYTDDDGVECQPTLPITVNGEEAIGKTPDDRTTVNNGCENNPDAQGEPHGH